MLIDKLIAVFIALALLGAGCKDSATTAIPEETEQARPQADAGAEAEMESEDVEEERVDAGVPDSGSVIPEGWQIYRNPAWGIEQLAYPEKWHSRERTVEETGEASSLWVDLSPDPIEPLLEADPVYPMTIIIEATALEQAIAEYQASDLAREDVTVGGKAMVKLSYTADLLDARVVAYLYAFNGFVINISGPESLSELATVAANLVARR